MGITVDAQKFSVKLTRDAIGGEDGKRSFLGLSDESDNTIVIDGTMPKTRQEEVLLHEIFHLAAPDLPEFMIAALSTGAYGILKNNNLLAANIVEKVADGTLSRLDTERINEASNKIAEVKEEMGELVLREVSEQPAHGN